MNVVHWHMGMFWNWLQWET